MSQRCDLLLDKGIQVGHKVSHSMRKTKKRFKPNLQMVTMRSDALDQNVRLRLAVHTIRSVDHNYGIDGFLLKTSDSKLTTQAIALKKRIKEKVAAV